MATADVAETRSTALARGLIAFPITPTDADGRVDADALRRLVLRAAEAGVDGVCVLGSTGTYAYLGAGERARAVEVAAEALTGGPPLMAGIGALSTRDVIAHARAARDAGAVAGLLAPMAYTPLTEDEVFAHFEAVAGEGGLPVIVYDNPIATHCPIGDRLMARLARIPGVVGSKSFAPPPEEVPARVAALRAAVPHGFSVGFSTDWNVTEALIAGGDAWYSVLAGLFPKPAAAIWRAVAAGDHERARALNAALEPMWAAMRTHSGLRTIYAAAEIAGVCTAAPPRPILPLGADARRSVGEAMRASGLP